MTTIADQLAPTLAAAVAMFAGTTCPPAPAARLRPWQICVGQYAGIGALVAISVIAGPCNPTPGWACSGFEQFLAHLDLTPVEAEQVRDFRRWHPGAAGRSLGLCLRSPRGSTSPLRPSARRAGPGPSYPGRQLRATGVVVTLVVHEHKRLGRGSDLAALAEQLRAAGIDLGVPHR